MRRGGATLELKPFDALASLRPLPARTDSLTWTRRMRVGQELRVYTMKSDIQAEPSPDLDVHLITIFGPDDGRGPRQHEFVQDERSIEVCPALPAGVNRAPDSGCYPADWDRERLADNTVRTVVQVPDGILLTLRTYTGAIVADRIKWPLVAETVDGDVHIRSSGAVSVNAVGGNVDVSLARTNWIDRQYLKTVSGRITLRLPADANVELTMKQLTSSAHTSFAIDRKWRGARGRTYTLARLGAGSRELYAETWTGGITVVRDGDLAAPPMEDESGANAAGGDGGPDPEPNPNPDFGGDSPSPTPSASPSANTRPYRVSAGGETDERVALDLPGDFMLRHDAARLRGALDSASRMALLRLASPRWDAYQRGVVDPGVNLVGDRALWALSVSEDVDLTGAMVEQIGSGDWRVRAYAAWVLGESGTTRGSRALVSALEDPQWRVRVAAASAMASVRATGGVTTLERLLADPQYQVRTAALEALTAIGDAHALPRAREMLTHEHAMVRAQAQSAVSILSERLR